MKAKVLLIEDSKSLAMLYKQYVKDEAYDFFHVETGHEAMRFIEREAPQLVILDLKLPDIPGESILDWLVEHNIPSSVIVATAHGSIDVAVNLLQKGAKDFLEKPINADRLKTSINLHLQQTKLESLVEDIESKFDRRRYHGFIGSSLPMQGLYKIIDSVAPTSASVFIIGESGTGKEVCAEAIHKESKRNNKPFIAINCGAIPKDLMESEIFGHVKGAFTGATTDRKGAATLAHGGTLFLDELCEMELEMQKKLLRFLQTGTFSPLGASSEHKVDVRIICATNRDPLIEVEQGRFREDLYYRVHVVPIEMPPLRERNHDIVTLAKHFLRLYAKEDGKQFTTISGDAVPALKRYAWPGNVRQLQNIIRNIVVLNDQPKLSLSLLPSQFTSGKSTAQPRQILGDSLPSLQDSLEPVINEPQSQTVVSHNEVKPMWQIERDVIQQAIELCDGNVLNAAVLLELSPSTIYRKKQAWETNGNPNDESVL